MLKTPILFSIILSFVPLLLHASQKKFLIAALHGNVDGLKKEFTADKEVLTAIDHEGKNAFDLAVEARAYRIGIETGKAYHQNTKPLDDFFSGWFTSNRANLTPKEKKHNKKLQGEQCLVTIFNTYRTTIQFLLEQHSFEVDKHTQYGMTALHTAALSDDQDLVTSLLEHGASPFKKCKPLGATALHFAAIVNTSRTYGAQGDIRDHIHVMLSPHYTPSPLDIQRMKITGFNYSLQNKWTSIHQAINAQDHNGRTPLMVAIKAAASVGNDHDKHVLQANAIRLLENPAVKLKLKNKDGKTALDLAQESNLGYIAYKIEGIVTSREQRTPLQRLPLPKLPRAAHTQEQEADLKQYLVFGKKSST